MKKMRGIQVTMGRVLKGRSAYETPGIPNVKWESETGRLGQMKGTCPFCDHSTIRPSKLARHIMSVHYKATVYREGSKLIKFIILFWQIVSDSQDLVLP